MQYRPALSNQLTGKLGEHLVAKDLARHHFYILERNWRCPAGEIDVLALRNRIIYSVEVKTRIIQPTDERHPFDNLSLKKVERQSRLLLLYSREKEVELQRKRLLGRRCIFAAVSLHSFFQWNIEYSEKP